LSSLIILIFSSLAAKKISAPFSSLNNHIRAIAERNFCTKVDVNVDDELRDFANNINIMSEKLETYDKAQKTFLQNASHEFRTPLMSIQSYAEGIKYGVLDDTNSALDIIISETKRLSNLVEELLFLSRLDSIEENFHFNVINFNELIKSSAERMKALAIQKNITFDLKLSNDELNISADEEKLERAISNIISNCLRYAKSNITICSRISDNNIELYISDDGPGFDEADLPNLFTRFYKGKKGNFGLGLAITKSIIEKHNGKITAENTGNGAKYVIFIPNK
jgi:signal transduction histidine kinase